MRWPLNGADRRPERSRRPTPAKTPYNPSAALLSSLEAIHTRRGTPVLKSYKFELTLRMTIEANSIEDAEDEVDWHKGQIIDNGFAGDLGYTEAYTSLIPLTEE